MEKAGPGLVGAEGTCTLVPMDGGAQQSSWRPASPSVFGPHGTYEEASLPKVTDTLMDQAVAVHSPDAASCPTSLSATTGRASVLRDRMVK